MATHSSVLAWRIPGTREPGGLPSMGSHRVGHDWSDLAAAAAAARLVIAFLPRSKHLLISWLWSQLQRQEEKYGVISETPCPRAAAAKSLQSCWTDSVRPHRRQPSRLPHPWDSPGKNTGVGCHFLLQCSPTEGQIQYMAAVQTLRQGSKWWVICDDSKGQAITSDSQRTG